VTGKLRRGEPAALAAQAPKTGAGVKAMVSAPPAAAADQHQVPGSVAHP